MMRRTLLAGLLAIGWSGIAVAQRPEPVGEAGAQRGRGRGQGDRAGLEMQLRQRLAKRAQTELGLAPEQMTKLADVDRRFGQQQRAVDQRENQTRQALRKTLLETASPDQDRRVGELHDQLIQLQRQRFDLVVGEQKELAGFMTNVQRVRFQALQENFRRQLQEAFRPADGSPGRGRGRPPL